MNANGMTADDSNFIIRNISSLVTMDGPALRRGRELGSVDTMSNWAIHVKSGKIQKTGPEKELLKGWKGRTLDAEGCAIVPGLVDPHTHAVFAGNRWYEFEMRLSGAAYMDILNAGGGILSTVEATRQASVQQLKNTTHRNLKAMLACGTTTVEIKSGYGLDRETELKQLRAVKEAAELFPGTVIPTYMGAHAIPPEFKGNPARYLDWLVSDALPEVAGSNLARYADIFCEHGVFDVPQSRKYLKACSDFGLIPRIHADEIEPMGGAELAVEIGAASADHLGAVSEAGINALVSSNTVAVLLPVTLYYLFSHKYAPARQMIEKGVAVALSTDFNPGSSPCRSMPQAMNLACTMMKMTPAETLGAATVNAAYSLNLSDRCGRIKPGFRADMLVVDDCDWRAVVAMPGASPVKAVIAAGNIVTGDLH